MKRISLIVLVVAACCLSFAAGQEAEKLKWPWAKEKWSKDSGLSVLEVELLKANVDAKPIMLAPYARLETLVAEAKDQGVLVKAGIVLTRKPESRNRESVLQGLAHAVNVEWSKRLGNAPRWEEWPYEIHLYIGGKHVHTEAFNSD
jgi:hypothetical protein